MSPVLLLVLFGVAVVVALILFVQNLTLRRDIAVRVGREVDRWRESELARAKVAVEQQVRGEAALAMDRWKATQTSAVRRDAIKRSQAVTVGKVTEQLVPYLPGFEFNPKDVRFLGSPIDLIVFDGLHEDALTEVVFVEVKTGGAGLSGRERRVRDAIQARRVSWVELRLPS
jgi:predicted Holliday junction resolvase-like endonuclease